MSTNIKSELSKKNKYWIERLRYYELKYYCLQYPAWVKTYNSLDSMNRENCNSIKLSKTNKRVDTVELCVEKRATYLQKIEAVKLAAIATDNELYSYILKGVTEGATYTYLRSKLNIPCCRDVYYDLYRKFFWILDASQN